MKLPKSYCLLQTGVIKQFQTLIKRHCDQRRRSPTEKQSRVFVYTPAVKEDEYIRQQSSSFLNRYYDGNITAMVSSYIENDKLSKSELDTLRTLLSQKQEKGGE